MSGRVVGRQGGGVSLDRQAPSARRLRRPAHKFICQVRPWELTPVLIAPVLAGETLRQASIQARFMSASAVRNTLCGWWAEFYLFYVRIGDLADQEGIRAEMITPTEAGLTGLATAVAVPQYYHSNTTIVSWVFKCLPPIVRAYFRSEDDSTPTTGLEPQSATSGMPMIAAFGNGWWDSMHTQAEMPLTGSEADDWEEHWTRYQQMRNAKLTTATWEEFLAARGVSTPERLRETEADFRIPELVRFTRDFAMPQETVDPDTGAVVGRLVWNMSERVDKRRFFAEPGFLVGLAAVRPKAYMRKQTEAMADVLMRTGGGWMPAEYETDPMESILNIGTADPGGFAATAAYVLDRRDLFLYGDQFVNFDCSGTTYPAANGDWNLVDLPAADLSSIVYPVAADADRMFVSGATSPYVKVDGVCTFRVATRLVDTTF